MVFSFNTIYETNYCPLFAANVRAHSMRIKQIESLKIVSVEYKHPRLKCHRYKPLNINNQIYSNRYKPQI